VKEAASRYFCWGEARAWVYIRHLEGLQIVPTIRENSELLRFRILVGGGRHLKF
jgi:hypothetical protein